MNCLAKEALYQKNFFGDVAFTADREHFIRFEGFRRDILTECEQAFGDFLMKAGVIWMDTSPEITGVIGRLKITFSWNLPEPNDTSFRNLIEMRLALDGGLCLKNAAVRIVVSLDCVSCAPEAIYKEWVKFLRFQAFSADGHLILDKKTPDFREFLEEFFSGCE